MRYEWTADTIRALRMRLRLTQADMGHITGVTRSAVAQWEAGQRSPSGARTHALTTIQRLIDAGHIAVAERSAVR